MARHTSSARPHPGVVGSAWRLNGMLIFCLVNHHASTVHGCLGQSAGVFDAAASQSAGEALWDLPRRAHSSPNRVRPIAVPRTIAEGDRQALSGLATTAGNPCRWGRAFELARFKSGL